MFMGYLGKNNDFKIKNVILCSVQKRAQNGCFGFKNYPFALNNPKPNYIDLNIFIQKFFWIMKYGPMKPPWGTLGPYLGSRSWNVFKTQWA